MIVNSRAYKRFEETYAKWGALLQVITGGVLIVLSVFVAIVALTTFHQQSNERNQRIHEQHTVHNACVRARAFGPPLILHLERVENILHLGALEEKVEYPEHSKKFVGVLDYYRSTIPKKCP